MWSFLFHPSLFLHTFRFQPLCWQKFSCSGTASWICVATWGISNLEGKKVRSDPDLTRYINTQARWIVWMCGWGEGRYAGLPTWQQATLNFCIQAWSDLSKWDQKMYFLCYSNWWHRYKSLFENRLQKWTFSLWG